MMGGWYVPHGAFSVASYLKACGAAVSYIDAGYRWDRALSGLPGYWPPKKQGFGLGPLYREPAACPPLLKTIPMNYKVYGMPYRILEHEVERVPRPDVVLVASGLCYHYRGAFRVVDMVKRIFPGVPIVLGGIYATLCSDHARAFSGADDVVVGEGEFQALKLVEKYSGATLEPRPWFDLDQSVVNDLALYRARGDYLDCYTIMTSRGCAFRCHYCASGLLQKYRRKSPKRCFAEIEQVAQSGITNFVFYDDALLLGAEDYFDPMLRLVCESKLRCFFHTPNSLHARFITAERAALMVRAGFRVLRLSIETVNQENQERTGKVSCDDLRRAVSNLLGAGMSARNISVYYMVGQPGQSFDDVVDTMSFISSLGVMPMPLPYSLIPGTADFLAEVAAGRLPADADPLLSNKELLPFLPPGKSRADLKRVLRLARVIRNFGKYGLSLFGNDPVVERFRGALAKVRAG